MSIFRNMLAGVAALAAAVALGQTADAQGTIDQIRDRGVLRVAGIPTEAPYFVRDIRTGEWSGFVVDMAADMAETMGVELEMVESSWANSILDIQSGRVDVAFALTALPARALSIYFSEPTYYNSFVIVSPDAELANASWAELNSPDITIAVDTGSAQDNIARAYLPNANMLRFQTRDEAVIAVATGRADALINTVLNSMVMRTRNPAIGDIYVPEPRLSSPSVIGINYSADEQFKTFVSAWANYNRQMGNNQTWIVGGMAPFGITMDDLPQGFDFGG
ncbi:MAG: transporter substrate-binding domain-containing protein [Rhodobacteraceae bacterium]|nr:transporter substrate-binding domain-containing protein [Paracoccaceae bacterium]